MVQALFPLREPSTLWAHIFRCKYSDLCCFSLVSVSSMRMHRPQSFLGCLDPGLPWIADQRQLKPEGSVQGRSWPSLMLRINILVFSGLGAAIQGYVVSRHQASYSCSNDKGQKNWGISAWPFNMGANTSSQMNVL